MISFRRLLSAIGTILVIFVAIFVVDRAMSKDLLFDCEDEKGIHTSEYYHSGFYYYWFMLLQGGIEVVSSETDTEYEIVTILAPTAKNGKITMITHISKADGVRKRTSLIESLDQATPPIEVSSGGSCKLPPNED